MPKLVFHFHGSSNGQQINNNNNNFYFIDGLFQGLESLMSFMHTDTTTTLDDLEHRLQSLEHSITSTNSHIKELNAALTRSIEQMHVLTRSVEFSQSIFHFNIFMYEFCFISTQLRGNSVSI
jgi:hypothetical protein